MIAIHLVRQIALNQINESAISKWATSSITVGSRSTKTALVGENRSSVGAGKITY